MNHWSWRLVVVLAIVVLFPAYGRAQQGHGNGHNDVPNVVVHFGQPQPQGAPPATTHFLLPDDVTIKKGGTVTFIVNGGGHGIAVHRVDEDTTREDIAEDLCQGPPGTDEADRAARSTVCNGTIVTGMGTPVIIGTQNLNYDITDGDDELVIRTGVNNPASGDPAQNNPRVDDTAHSQRLLSTSGRTTDTVNASSANPAGAFLAGSTSPVVNPPNGNPGNRIEVTFLKGGRFLVICQNRGHSLNDHMFGFVTVGDDDDDDDR